MSWRPLLQSAPVQDGYVGDSGGWSGASGSDPTMSGSWQRKTNATVLFIHLGGSTATIGTTASIPIRWQEGAVAIREFDVGTNTGYTAGDIINIGEGVSISFSAGTIVASDNFTVTMSAWRRIRPDHREIVADAEPVAMEPVSLGFDDLDTAFRADDGSLRQNERAIGRSVDIFATYLEGKHRRALSHMIHARHEVTFGENYDHSTVFLWRGGTVEPFIGHGMTFTRSSEGTYWDPDSGLIRLVDDNIPRKMPGPEIESLADGASARVSIPFQYNHVGSAHAQSNDTRTNLIVEPHPAGSGTLNWSSDSGSPTLTWVTDVAPVLYPGDGWAAGYDRGTVRVKFNATGDRVLGDTAVGVSGSTDYQASLWLKARGDLLFVVYGGSGSPGSQRYSAAIPSSLADGDQWIRIDAQITSGGSDNTLAVGLESDSGQGIAWISGAAIVQSDQNQPMVFAGNVRAPETMTVNDPIPEVAGTISFWFYNGGDDGSSGYSLLETTSGDRFAIRYNATSTGQINFFTDTTGSITGTFPTQRYSKTWNHVAVTWVQHSVPTTILREVYLNGVYEHGDTTTVWEPGYGSLEVLPNAAAETPNDWGIAEIRIDSRVRTATEILEEYERYASGEGIHHHVLWAGRQFKIVQSDLPWISTVNPDKASGVISLSQSSVHEPSLVTRK